MLLAIASEFIRRVAGLITGEVVLADLLVGTRLFLGTLFLVLPCMSTLLLILVDNRRPRQMFNVAVWGLALSICLLVGLSAYPSLYWELWGIWLYIGLAASVLVLEVLMLAAEKKPA